MRSIATLPLAITVISMFPGTVQAQQQPHTPVSAAAASNSEAVPPAPGVAPSRVSMKAATALGPHDHDLYGDSGYRSPELAVALSLTPLPVDFGNLYAENLGWGLAYTAVEVSLMTPMMWLVGGHMDHGRGVERTWSDTERNAMLGLVIGYVAVKLVAGIDAGKAASELNRRQGVASLATLARF